MKSLPHVRTGFLRHKLDNQVLVYDSRGDRVHLLDPTTARVMELLEEGGWTPEGIVIELSERFGISATPAFLELAISELRTAELLDEASAIESGVDVSRRDVLRKVAMAGAAALLVPAITTLTATPGYAQSGTRLACATCQNSPQCCCGLLCNATSGLCGGLAAGATCNVNSDCCSNNCVNTKGTKVCG